MNLKIRQFEDDLVNLINSNDLPIEVKRIILQDVLQIVENKANEIILKELSSEPITEYGELKDAESTRCEQE